MPEEVPTEKGAAKLILARQLKWPYLLILVFLVVLGFALILLGANELRLWFRAVYAEDPGSLVSALIYFATGILAWILAVVVRQVRRYFIDLHEQTVAEIKNVELRNIKEEDFEQVDQILELREEKARADFERNLSDPFLIDSLKIAGLEFFGPFTWQLKPGVNVLLGRNGYGKSLLLRCLAALLQKDDKGWDDLFEGGSPDASLELTVLRNGTSETIRRERKRFTKSVGKIPMLAIPDTRFVNRLETSIETQRKGVLNLRVDGALHFLEDRPYGEVMQKLFAELCADYLEGRSFSKPSFSLLQNAIKTLTDETFKFKDVERVDRDAFRILVLTEGNERPVPIQYASQGTLSVIGVVGIIRSYLSALFPEARDEDLLEKAAIVFVDELDAHLHPLWQQKLSGILRENFPNVQFVLSAHSPLVVAGCWNNEVAVLRKNAGRFVLQQVERDFVGTPVEEIYETIFGVETIDESYLQSATRAKSGFSNEKRISELEKKTEPTELERRELARLIREEGMIRRAAEVKAERVDDQERIGELEAQVESLEKRLQRAASNDVNA